MNNGLDGTLIPNQRSTRDVVIALLTGIENGWIAVSIPEKGCISTAVDHSGLQTLDGAIIRIDGPRDGSVTKGDQLTNGGRVSATVMGVLNQEVNGNIFYDLRLSYR